MFLGIGIGPGNRSGPGVIQGAMNHGQLEEDTVDFPSWPQDTPRTAGPQCLRPGLYHPLGYSLTHLCM